MVPRTRRTGWVIQQAQFRAHVEKTGQSRATICGEIGFEDGKVGTRLSRGTAFDRAEVERFATAMGCKVSDFARPTEELESMPQARAGGEGERPRVALAVLDGDDMRKKYEKFDASSFVLVFSMDGYLEAGNRYFREIVFGAVKRGLEIFYLFPDSEVARQSREHYEQLAELALKDRLRLHGHFVDASNTYIATRAARFVLAGKKADDNTRLVDAIYVYLHSKQDYWIELDLKDHQDFITELQAAIDPIPYLPIPVWKKKWHLPPFVQERYQTSFTRDSKTYSRLRQIVRTEESALRIAGHAVDHFDKIRFDRENDVVHWLDIGCEDGDNTAVIFDYLQKHHFNIALTAIDTSLQGKSSPALKYATFLHGRKWTFEHLSTALPRHQKFDLITSLHSWYVIDPIYLVEAYRRLSTHGNLIVTMGPYGPDEGHGGNFINLATGAIDALIAKEAGLEPDDDVYRHKAVRSDPYRNYAEDILTACGHFFGNQNEDFIVEIEDRSVPAGLFLGDTNLTDAGRAISSFFAHGLPPHGGEAAMFERVFDLLCGLRTDEDMLPAAELDILIDRQTIMRRQAKRLRLHTRA
jgi:hypothetical protein